MPQTLLAILAITIAGFLTLGQSEMMNDTVNHVMEDELEVIVSGTLLHTLEVADSRAFDEFTRPTNLRTALGITNVMSAAAIDSISVEDLDFIRPSDFADPSDFGLVAGTSVKAECNLRRPAESVDCDDISDLHSTVEGADGWQSVAFSTVGGDSLNVEVRVDVGYVEIGAPDDVVTYPTFHKRVDVYARSPLMAQTNPGHQIHSSRVISYDPVVAIEYLQRMLHLERNSALDAAEAALREAQEAVRAAEEVSNAAQVLADRARVDLAEARNAAANGVTDTATLQARVTAAEAALAAARAGTTGGNIPAAEAALESANQAIEQAVDDYWAARSVYFADRTQENYNAWYGTYLRYVSGIEARTAAEAALEAAKNAEPVVDAAAVAEAEQALAAARDALIAAQEGRNNAQAAVEAAEAALAAAEGDLAQAISDYEQALTALDRAQSIYDAALATANANG